MGLPLHRFCGAVHAWMLQHTEKPDEFEYHLTKPIPGKTVVTERDIRSELDDFDAFAGMMGGGAR